MTDQSETLFAQDAVKQLTQDDFELDSDAPIKLRYNSCIIILFYNNNIESNNLVQLWNTAATQVAGPTFASINLMNNRALAKAFTNLNMKNSALHWAGLRTMPFILVYQNRWPIGFYNGERTVQDFIDYSLTLACRAEYHEPINLYGGQLASDNFMMQGLTQYGSVQNPFKKTSIDFTGKEDLRGYDPNDKPVLAGTAREAEEQREVQQRELVAGTEIAVEPETPTAKTPPIEGSDVEGAPGPPTSEPLTVVRPTLPVSRPPQKQPPPAPIQPPTDDRGVKLTRRPPG